MTGVRGKSLGETEVISTGVDFSLPSVEEQTNCRVAKNGRVVYRRAHFLLALCFFGKKMLNEGVLGDASLCQFALYG